MNNNPRSQRQLNMTTWTLLFVILILAGVAVFLRPDAAPAPNVGGTARPPAATEARPEVENSAADSGEAGWISDKIILALQAAIGAGFFGYLIGLKRGERRALNKLTKSQTDASSRASGGNGYDLD
jgi:hypothetical protein